MGLGLKKMDNEYWKDLNLESGWYQISNLGRIRKVALLHPYIDKTGYSRVCIRGKLYSIHRLVAEAFIPNPDHKEQVNHIDSDPKNNKVENLEWVTSKENILHSYYNGNRFYLEVIRMEDGKKYPNISKIAKDYNINWGTIKQIIRKKDGKKVFYEKELEEIIKKKKDNRIGKIPLNAIKVCYLPTKKIYFSMTEAARDLGFNSIYQMMKIVGKDIKKLN